MEGPLSFALGFVQILAGKCKGSNVMVETASSHCNESHLPGPLHSAGGPDPFLCCFASCQVKQDSQLRALQARSFWRAYASFQGTLSGEAAAA